MEGGWPISLPASAWSESGGFRGRPAGKGSVLPCRVHLGIHPSCNAPRPSCPSPSHKKDGGFFGKTNATGQWAPGLSWEVFTQGLFFQPPALARGQTHTLCLLVAEGSATSSARPMAGAAPGGRRRDFCLSCLLAGEPARSRASPSHSLSTCSWSLSGLLRGGHGWERCLSEVGPKTGAASF